MFLGKFCSEYRVIYTGSNNTKGESKRKRSPVHTLKNDLGYIQKRSRTDPAVIRYPRFSVVKCPEKYYQSILQLFLPYRVDAQLKPPKYDLYEHFYINGFVQLNNELQSVKCIVEKNRSLYESNVQALDEAKEFLEKFGPQEDAWDQICPETEQERLECQKERPELVNDSEDECEIPDLI